MSRVPGAVPPAPRRDPFAALEPAGAARLPVAWHSLTIAGPPPAFALREAERLAPTPAARFARRTVLNLACSPAEDAAAGDHLALIDKVSPHARFDLMLSEISAREKAGVRAVSSLTGQVAWRVALEFARFVSQPEPMRRFGLGGGRLYLALNSDAHTRDRESVQASKQFHLHLIYWCADELARLGRGQPLATIGDRRLRRQCLDPLSFLGAHLLTAALADLDLGVPDAALLPPDDALTCAGRRPLGCVIRLPGWSVLETPAFERMMRRLDERIERAARDLLRAFTGQSDAPPPWRRWPPRPAVERAAAIAALGYNARITAGLLDLGAALRDLPPRRAARLRGASPARRMHCMTLNQPCYGMNLFAPMRKKPEPPPIDAPEIWLVVQAKLFSGIGSAGLVALDALPSVRIVRGQGCFSPPAWRRRAAFQHAFATHLNGQLATRPGVQCAAPNRFVDFDQGWRA